MTLLRGVKSFCFSDDDDSVIPLYTNLTYPFCTKIINPEGTKFKRWKSKRILYNSYQKLAYLHPNTFQPKIEVLEKYNLMPYKYVVIRNSALQAHNDYGATGISKTLWKDIQPIISNYKIIQTTENKGSFQIDPWDMHHVLSFAKLLISDSQSMSVESSVLGTPNLRYSTFSGRISCLEELEHKYGLTKSFKPGEEDNLIQTTRSMVNDDNLNITWHNKKNTMLEEKIDFGTWIINFFENEVNKK